MKCYFDRAIPDVERFFGQVCDCVPQEVITPETIHDADILLVRSVTRVNQALLSDTNVRYVASPSSGSDHFDKTWLTEQDIMYFAAPGCNARSVADYVLASLAACFDEGILTEATHKIGIIGVGHVGHTLYHDLVKMGFEVVCYDPPRAMHDRLFDSSHRDALYDCDVLCFHPALTRTGDYPSFHLVDNHFLQQLTKPCVIIQASRGAVIDTRALLATKKDVTWCLDVFENEPDVLPEVIDKALIATPHIAGHAYNAKLRGVAMIYDMLQAECNWPRRNVLLEEGITINLTAPDWTTRVLELYDPRIESRAFKEAYAKMSTGETFTEYRAKHRRLRELAP